MQTYKLNNILDFKAMGHNGYDQTACLAGFAQYIAEDHSRDQSTRRHLTKRRKETIRTTKTKRKSQQTNSKSSEIFTAARG